MSRQQRLSAMLALCVILLASSGYAFDGNRRGFMLDVGIGPTLTDADFYYDNSDKFGFGTDFKIGGGINSQVQLYWIVRTAWFNNSYPRYDYDQWGNLYRLESETVTLMNGFYGGGITYFFQTQAPSWFMVGALGAITLQAPFEDNSDSESGTGFSFGAGYEFSPHWTVEASWSYGEIYETGISSWKVVIAYLAY